MNLVGEDHPALWERALVVTNIGNEVVPHVVELAKLMVKNRGLGLGAPQVGIPFRFFAWVYRGCIVISINPEIVRRGKDEEWENEGCLTWPGKRRPVLRHRIIGVRYTNLGGETVEMTLKGFAARIFQHELDHLNGVCLFQRKVAA